MEKKYLWDYFLRSDNHGRTNGNNLFLFNNNIIIFFDGHH